jgi:cell division protein FtsQ
LPEFKRMRPSPRRGTGKWRLLALLFILSGIGYGLWYGGHGPRFLDELRAAIETTAVASGFGVKRITVEGQRRTTDAEITTALAAGPSTMMLAFDTDAAKERLEAMSWIKHAQVMRLLPSTLQVVIEERAPFAIWQRDGKTYVVDEKGAVLAPALPEAYPALPVVVGVGAEKNAASLLEALEPYPELRRQLLAAMRVGDRRWTLKLTSGLEIMLPDDNVGHALETLASVTHERGLIGKTVAAVDLRLADRVTLRIHEKSAVATSGVSGSAVSPDVPTASTKQTNAKGST